MPKKEFPIPFVAVKQEVEPTQTNIRRTSENSDNESDSESTPTQTNQRRTSENSDSDLDSDSMGESRSQKCENLTKSNYNSWKLKIEAVLATKKCWLKLDGSESASENYAETAKRAYYEIMLHCDAEHAVFIQSVGEYNSVKVLVALREKYEGKGFMAKFGLLQKCLTMRHHSGPIDSHIDEMRSSFQRLAEKELQLPEIVQVANLIISLPADLSHVITGFINTAEKDLKFETVASAILAEQRRISITDGDHKHHVAVPANHIAAPAKSMSYNNRRKLLRCTFCNKNGHTEENCFLKQGRSGTQTFKQKPSTKSAPADEDDDIATPATMYANAIAYLTEVEEESIPMTNDGSMTNVIHKYF